MLRCAGGSIVVKVRADPVPTSSLATAGYHVLPCFQDHPRHGIESRSGTANVRHDTCRNTRVRASRLLATRTKLRHSVRGVQCTIHDVRRSSPRTCGLALTFLNETPSPASTWCRFQHLPNLLWSFVRPSTSTLHRKVSWLHVVVSTLTTALTLSKLFGQALLQLRVTEVCPLR